MRRWPGNLAVDLSETGRRAEALTAAEEAAYLSPEQAAGNRNAYVPDLAMPVKLLERGLSGPTAADSLTSEMTCRRATQRDRPDR